MKVFPHFAATIEDMLPSPAADPSEVRAKVNTDYTRIHRAMFKCLQEVGSKDQESVGTGGDEEKEALNHHILLIENHNHYIEEVDVRHNPALMQGKQEAQDTMTKHMAQYVDRVVRRPLEKLFTVIESAEAAISVTGEAPPSSITTLASHRSANFRKQISSFDAKEIRKGVELLKKRVEKHFGDADDERISGKLVEKVTKECEEKYYSVLDRIMVIVTDVYEGQIEVELKREDIAQAFRR